METTQNLGLSLTGTAGADVQKTFMEWRQTIDGTSDDSNMNKIDKAFGQMTEQLKTIKAKISAFSIDVSAWQENGPFVYELSPISCTEQGTSIIVTLDSESFGLLVANLECETKDGKIVFTTLKKPRGTISGTFMLLETDNVSE